MLWWGAGGIFYKRDVEIMRDERRINFENFLAGKIYVGKIREKSIDLTNRNACYIPGYWLGLCYGELGVGNDYPCKL